MRRIIFVTFIILTTIFCISAQSKTLEAVNNQIKTLKAEKYLETRYDKPSNMSKVSAFGGDFGKDQAKANNMNSLSFGMAYFFPGNAMTSAPDSLTTTFWAEEKNPTFAESNVLTFVVDGENLEVGNARYARKNGDARQFLNYSIPRKYIEKIVKGRDVQIKIGKAQFKFKPEQMTVLSNLLAVSNPTQ
jgi:hypothetical protein